MRRLPARSARRGKLLCKAGTLRVLRQTATRGAVRNSAMAEKKLWEVDGSLLEGGGQVVRMSTALAVLLENPVRITKVRAGRPKPGLKAQHATGVQLLADICGGALKGCSMDSVEVELRPSEGRPPKTEFQGHISTAGSVTLLLQSALSCLAFAAAPSRLSLRGGTNVHFAPQLDYATRVLRPQLRKMGLDFEVDTRRRGFFPKGGGEVLVTVSPVQGTLKPLSLTERGTRDQMKLRMVAVSGGRAPEARVRAMAAAAEKELRSGAAGAPVEVSVEPPSGPGDGMAVLLLAEFPHTVLAADFIAKRGQGEGHWAREAAKQLLSLLASEAAVDEHLQDQLLLYMALAEGRSVVRAPPLTLHSETAIHLAEELTEAKFTVQERPDGTVDIACDGIGYTAPSYD